MRYEESTAILFLAAMVLSDRFKLGPRAEMADFDGLEAMVFS